MKRNTNLQDAKKPVVIKVTRDHCQKGKRGDKTNCIIAIAAKQQTGGFIDDVRVGLRYTTFRLSSGARVRYSTPIDLSKRLERFDKGGPLLKPGQYEFKAPRKSETIEYQRRMTLKYHQPSYKAKTRGPNKRRVQSRSVINHALIPAT